jgi:hypothetical protein
MLSILDLRNGMTLEEKDWNVKYTVWGVTDDTLTIKRQDDGRTTDYPAEWVNTMLEQGRLVIVPHEEGCCCDLCTGQRSWSSMEEYFKWSSGGDFTNREDN